MNTSRIILLGFGALAVILVVAYLLARRKSAANSAERSALQSKFLGAAVLVLVGFAGYEHWRIQELQSDESIISRFTWLWYYQPNTWRTTSWLGVETEQNPMDVWVHQEIITETQPDFIVETGTYKGGSALIWAMVLNQFKPEGRVITIDLFDHGIDGKKLAAWKNVDFLQGSSTDPKIIADVKDRVQGKKVMVILDSMHTKEHVLAELRAYAPLVPVGGYLIVQDTNLNGNPVLPGTGPGPMEAVEEFLTTNDQFVSDRTREKLLLTFLPKGYLKRVK